MPNPPYAVQVAPALDDSPPTTRTTGATPLEVSAVLEAACDDAFEENDIPDDAAALEPGAVRDLTLRQNPVLIMSHLACADLPKRHMNRRQRNKFIAMTEGIGDVPLSGIASASVRVVPDPDFACTDVIGRVFDDRDRDGAQTSGERGLSGLSALPRLRL